MSAGLADLAAAAQGRHVRAPAGTVLFRPDEECKGFIALRSGVIRVGITSENGREIVLYRVRPGDICLQTLSCLAEGRSYAAEGVAEEDVDAFLLSPQMFDTLLQGDATFRRLVLASIATRFGEYENVVEMLAFEGLEARLAEALLRLCDRDGVAHLTHEALAAEIGSAREAVSRQLSQFARSGLVALSRGRVSVTSRTALARLARGEV